MSLEYGKGCRKTFGKEENNDPEDILYLVTDSPIPSQVQIKYFDRSRKRDKLIN